MRNHSYNSDLHEIETACGLILMWKVSHIDSFWSRNTRILGNGLLELKRRCSWLDNIRKNPMSRLTWPVKIKHKTRSLNCFSSAVPLLEVLRKLSSARRNQPGEKVRQILPIPVYVWATLFRPGPRHPKRMTLVKYWGIGTKQIFIHDLLKDRQKYINFHGSRIFKMWHRYWPI